MNTHARRFVGSFYRPANFIIKLAKTTTTTTTTTLNGFAF